MVEMKCEIKGLDKLEKSINSMLSKLPKKVEEIKKQEKNN